MSVMDAVGVGTAVVGAITGGRRRRRAQKDRDRAIAELRAHRPTGYLTPEDYRAGELVKGRLSEGVQAQGQLAGYEVSRRARARGLGGSPSEERSQARLNQQVLLGKQHAGETAEELLYNTQRGREAYEQEKELAIFGARNNEATRQGQLEDAQQAEFWNSLNEFIPTIIGFTGTGGGGSSVTGFSPGSGPAGRGFSPGAIRRSDPGRIPF